YNIQGDSGIVGAGGSITNAGTIEKTAGTGTSVISAGLTDSAATLAALSGTLALATNSTNTDGTYIADSGATLDLTGGHSFSATGTFTAQLGPHGAGTITVGGGTFS